MSRLISNEKFIRRCKDLNGNLYDYSKTFYTGGKNNIIITCPIHGDFEQRANNHLYKGYGCPKCGIERRNELRKLPIEEFINKANDIHNNKYDYSKVSYNNMHDKVIIICPIHGEFLQTPQKHILRKHGCPQCNQSKGEKNVERFLISNNIDYISQYEITSKVNQSGKAFIDFYIPTLNTFIEYNGIQHYEYTPVFHVGGKVDFERQQKRDIEVEQYCENNNIKLIWISYKDDVNKVLEEWKQEI